MRKFNIAFRVWKRIISTPVFMLIELEAATCMTGTLLLNGHYKWHQNVVPSREQLMVHQAGHVVGGHWRGGAFSRRERTHWGLITHMVASELGRHDIKICSGWSAPSHCMGPKMAYCQWNHNHNLQRNLNPKYKILCMSKYRTFCLGFCQNIEYSVVP